MAAAEARAAWQRTANRCFVQEDAKRAPKLGCCPSSSSSSKLQFDAGPGDLPHGQDHPTTAFMPLNWNPSNPNIPPDTKCWLRRQPNFAYQKDFTYEQLNVLEAGLEVLRAEEMNKTSKLSGDHPLSEEDSTHADSNKNAGSYLDPQCWVRGTCTIHDTEARMHQLNAVNSNNTQQPVKHKDIGEHWYEEELLDKKLCSDLESPWMRSEKTEPWWRTVDKDELASLVAQKSHEHIENCDLPRPHIMRVSRGPFTCLECFDHSSIFSSSSDRKENTGLSNSIDYAQDCPTSGSVDRKRVAYGELRDSIYASDRSFRSLNSIPVVTSSNTNSYITTNKDPTETCCTCESELSRAQLLEALRHSQTRAREAEKAAQQANNEKEDIIKLFFRQASQLFAYKQWFQLLQLETLCLHLKNKDQPIASLFPVVLPWMPYKGRQLKKGWYKAAKRKQGPPRYISKYAVAFAVGLSLASAGLLLGWTMGWLLPTF